MKKIFKGLLLSFLLISSASLTSCFGFGEEALQINTITTVTLENGDIQVIITYTDEDVKPTTFVVPKGSAGEDGNGIQSIQKGEKTENNETLINIKFTNGQSVQVPIPNGEDGVSITGIDQTFDEETQLTTIIVNFSDGTSSAPILIPKGEKGDKGEDGVSIENIDYTTDRDNAVTLTIYLSDGTSKEVYIPGPKKGEDGREISNIEAKYDKTNDSYIFTVTYSDNSYFDFPVTRQNKWFTEDRKPDDKLDGKDGDIWYDVTNQVIYIKENKQWKEAINFEILKPEEFKVRFELNDSKSEPAEFATTKLNYIEYTEIEKGSYLSAVGIPIPEPKRNGYEFMGWYTVRGEYKPFNGMFTDLTPIMSDLTLYARWEKLESTQEPSEENTETSSEEIENN